MTKPNIKIVAFYQFHVLPDFLEKRQPLLAFMHALRLKGTILLAHEGINGGVAGAAEDIDVFCAQFSSFLGVDPIEFKVSYDTINPYDKTKVKIRKEIVTLGVDDVTPAEKTGAYLSPEAWHEMIQDPETIVIDTRNTYEVEMGSFKGAVNPRTRNFRDFPSYVEETLSPHKDKKIAMYCTGGIRCEKSTAYLLKLGFKQVYHLKGGILNYLETIPPEQSLWEGDCFVFDNRIALDHQLNPVPGAVSTKWPIKEEN